MKPHKLKQMIKLTEQEGVQQLLLLLLEYGQPDIHRNSHISTIEEFIEDLKKQLPVGKEGVQRDLEDLIDEVKNEQKE